MPTRYAPPSVPMRFQSQPGCPHCGAGHCSTMAGVNETVNVTGAMDWISKTITPPSPRFASPAGTNMCCRTVTAACEYVSVV